MSDEQGVGASGTTRRRFVQAAAAAGVIGAVWTEPVIRGSVAGAQTGISVDGRCDDNDITWSPNMDQWKSSNANTLVQAGTAAANTATFTWLTTNMDCTGLTSTVIISTMGTPEDSTGVTVEITTGVSCHFSDVMLTKDGMNASNGSLVPTTPTGTSFVAKNATDGGPVITFDILC